MKKIKILLFMLAFLLLGNKLSYAQQNTIDAVDKATQYSSESADIQGFLKDIQKYANEYFPELADENFIQNLIAGNKSEENMIDKIVNVLIGEFKQSLSLIFKIIGIAILCTILKSLQLNFSETSIGDIAFYVCYLMIVSLLITSFTNIVTICSDAVSELANFMKLVVPLIFALMTVTGSITSIATLQPVLLGMIAVVTFLLKNIVIPMIYISTVINIVTNISSNISLDKLAELIRKTALGIVEFSLLIFTCILSLEGTLASTVDGITSKIAKNVVSSAIPVVGKLLGDTVDSVIGGVAITKNAIGVIGVLVILAITISPLIKSFIVMIVFNLSAAFIEPIADTRISKCMNGMAGSLKIMVGILATIVFIFIIGITMMIRISNASLMYQS